MRKLEIDPISSNQDATGIRVAIVLSLLVLTFAIHGDGLQMGFGRDDGRGLAMAARLSPADYFLDPPTSAAVSGFSVSPWNVLVYDVNILLFGLNSYWHHFHLVLVVWVTSLVTYLFLRLWLPVNWSVLGATLFLSGAPTLYVSHEEMCGHYLYGLLFLILSIHLFISPRRAQQNSKLDSASALFYLFSVACKEIYVPLPLVLALYPDENIARRLLRTRFHWTVLICYAIWRYHAFGGSLIGPKGLGPDPLDAVTHLAVIPERLFGSSIFLIMAALVFTVIGIAKLRGRQWWFALSILTVLLIPLYPVSVNPGFPAPNRLLYLIWWVICVSFSWSGFMAPIKFQKPALLLMVGLCISTTSALSAWRHEIERSKHMWSEYYSFPQQPGKNKNLYFLNDLEDGYFGISGNMRGMMEVSIRLGLAPEDKVNLITERRAIIMMENSSYDTPGNSYIFDPSANRIRKANDAEELARWKNEVTDFVKIYVSRAIPKLGYQLIGHVDEINLLSNQIHISGWAPSGRLAVGVSERCDSLGYEISDRPDVVASTGNSDWLRSGFRITLKCTSAEEARIVASNHLCVITEAQSFTAVLENPAYSQCRKLSEGRGEWKRPRAE